MKKFIQAFVLLLGILGGFYVGGYVMCFGGIVDFINALKDTPTNAILLAVGLMKFLFASLVGWIIFYSSLIIVGLLE